MSVPVEPHAVRDRIAEYGAVAYLVTVSDEGRAHVVSVEVRVEGDRLVVPTGRTSRRNLEANPELTLLWPPGPDPAYSMLVDATATAFSDEPAESAVEPRSAVLHRVAGATGDGPTCLPLSDPDPDLGADA
jgi:hypothetical protein